MCPRSWSTRIALLALPVALAIGASPAARAADAGDADYLAGMAHANRGDLQTARTFFERAYAASRQWRYAFNASRTSTLVRDLPRAEWWIWRAGTLAATDGERRKAEAERLVIERQLQLSGHGRLAILVAEPRPGTVVQVEGEPVEDRGDAWVAWVKGGRRAVRVDTPGCVGADQTAVISPGERLSLVLQPCPLLVEVQPAPTLPPESAAAPAPAPRTMPTPLPDAPTQLVLRETHPQSERMPSYVAGTAGLAAMLGGAALMGLAAQASVDLNDRYRSGTLTQASYRAERADTVVRYALGGAALGAGAVGVALAWWWWPHGAVPRVALTPTALHMAWRF